MDGDRDEAVKSAASLRAWNWREAVALLAREPLPEKLRRTLAELGAQGHRLRLAVEAYDARVVRSIGDPVDRDLPALACRAWPEYLERAEALAAYGDAREAVAVLARAWVEGAPPGGEA